MTLQGLSLRQYQWLGRLFSPALLAWDSWRALRQPIYHPHRCERWARGLPAAPLDTPLLWIHAVSVGETQACAPLLNALLEKYPQRAVLLTHMTPTGRDTGRALFAGHIAAQRVVQCYLPYDLAGLTQRFLRHFKPQLGILMETEVWPNLVASCAASGVPIGLANGRLSEKSLRKALRFSGLAQSTYAKLSFLAAQSTLDAQRFMQVCPRNVSIVGNLKFDVHANDAQLESGKAFQSSVQRTSQRHIVALASTREGEERLLLTTLKPWLAAQTCPPLLLLVPRHPKRASEIAALLNELGLSFAQRSLAQPCTTQTQVYLADTLGEMWFYYGASTVAIVGGGWANLGGQNLIEPCMAGCAVIVGPNMFNFAAITQAALAQGAALQCDGVADLNKALDLAMEQQTVFASAGKVFATAHAGSTAKHLDLIATHIQK